MEIRLIAADMDGTLLDDEKRIPEENLRAFRACAAQGIEIVPATGRTMRGLPDELRNLPGVHYAILTNGAQCGFSVWPPSVSTMTFLYPTSLMISRLSGRLLLYVPPPMFWA